MPAMHTTFLHLTTFLALASRVVAQTAYANDFVDPDFILEKKYGPNTAQAQNTIISWANSLASNGPWTVMSKNGVPPSGTKHDYMSWAPYWWPDCSSVGNTTALTPEQVWVTCPYVNRDGQFNPDVRLINDVGNFQSMSEAVFYNAIAWTFDPSGKELYENRAVKFISAWFLDEDTRMNPNLDFAQMQRGPDGQVGSRTGVLDLKGMAKITSAILILRKGGSTAWTTDLDNQMLAWTRDYINWLETAQLALEEGNSANNHGTFYYNQLAALKILNNDLPGAKNVTTTYFNKQYMSQIVANGEQPLEAARTRPYHYRAYNLAAMITNARLDRYADPSSNVFTKPTDAGSNIKSALDFAMTIPASASKEDSYAAELYPNIAAVAAVYGDADNKYLNFLKSAEPGFMSEPFILWNQPFAENEQSGFASAAPNKTANANQAGTSKGKKQPPSNTGAAFSLHIFGLGETIALMATLVLGFSLI
ncbi:chondroitin AC/alginate lyase [Panaeolus papilionaceus]|nr:chondroitin AC/alginate lyase [Panaeolus papilionaceus]